MTDAPAPERREPEPDLADAPDPAPEPESEPVDAHRGPLDNDEDGRFLDRDDPRRLEAERRGGRSFDDEAES
jgi:hypothetical protein